MIDVLKRHGYLFFLSIFLAIAIPFIPFNSIDSITNLANLSTTSDTYSDMAASTISRTVLKKVLAVETPEASSIQYPCECLMDSNMTYLYRVQALWSDGALVR